ncbi:MAG: hypothetical protein WDN45_13210 [Caulobacteraceae bacterium]
MATWSATAAVLGAFVLSFCITTSMYGGGFATVPAYLADVFGTQYVGAIHGRLLTAWSTAGVLGPFIVTVLRDKAIAAGAPRAGIYPPIFLILAGLLVVGFLANLLVKPVAARWHMTGEDAQVTVKAAGGLGRHRPGPLRRHDRPGLGRRRPAAPVGRVGDPDQGRCVVPLGQVRPKA